jgi:hypothetical protein
MICQGDNVNYLILDLGSFDGARVNWRMMQRVVNHVAYFEETVRFHKDGRKPDAPCWILLNTLKSIDERYLVRTLFYCIYLFFLNLLKIALVPIFAIMFLEQNITSIVVLEGIPLSGGITPVWHPNIVVRGSYMILEDGVRVTDGIHWLTGTRS